MMKRPRSAQMGIAPPSELQGMEALFNDDDDDRPSKRMKGDIVDDILETYGPLGLGLRMSDSFLDLAENVIIASEKTKMKDKEKRKASNFPATVLQIGNYKLAATTENDLIAKFYYAKHRIVWEILLQSGQKQKIEMNWKDVIGINAFYPQNSTEHCVLKVELNCPPIFYEEKDHKPKQHSVWDPIDDFTQGEALKNRIHVITVSKKLLRKHFDKLMRCDKRLKFLSKKPFPSSHSPFFPVAQNRENESERTDPPDQVPHATNTSSPCPGPENNRVSNTDQENAVIPSTTGHVPSQNTPIHISSAFLPSVQNRDKESESAVSSSCPGAKNNLVSNTNRQNAVIPRSRNVHFRNVPIHISSNLTAPNIPRKNNVLIPNTRYVRSQNAPIHISSNLTTVPNVRPPPQFMSNNYNTHNPCIPAEEHAVPNLLLSQQQHGQANFGIPMQFAARFNSNSTQFIKPHNMRIVPPTSVPNIAFMDSAPSFPLFDEFVVPNNHVLRHDFPLLGEGFHSCRANVDDRIGNGINMDCIAEPMGQASLVLPVHGFGHNTEPVDTTEQCRNDKNQDSKAWKLQLSAIAEHLLSDTPEPDFFDDGTLMRKVESIGLSLNKLAQDNGNDANQPDPVE